MWKRLLFAAVLAAAAALVAPTAGAEAAGTGACRTSSPSSGAYTVNLCIAAPAAGTQVTGAVATTGTVTVTGTSPGVRRGVFKLDGAPLLTDYTSPYTFTLPSNTFVDGTHSLSFSALMRDGFTTAATSENLTFVNGVRTTPGPGGQFTPSWRAPAPGDPLVVAAVGDGAGGEPAETQVTDLIAGWNPNLVTYLGDVYEQGTFTEFTNWYGSNGFGYSRFAGITNPVIGNHEYSATHAATGYFMYWHNIPHYYSYTADGWHFIALDSTSQYGQTTPGTAQYNWLVNDLQHDASPCTIVYYHHPLYTVGSEPPQTIMSQMWQLFAKYHVTLVLNGHDHDYQRWTALNGSGQPDPSGVTEFVAGTGGHAEQSITNGLDPRVMKSNKGYGALRLSLSSNAASFAYEGTGGGLVDSGTVPCKGAGTGDTQPPSTPTGLAATNAGGAQVSLTWNASTDNVGVAGYTVYRNGSPLTTVPGGTTGYVDDTAQAGTTYTYGVDAFDAAGNHSTQSTTVTVTPGDQASIAPSGDAYVNASSPDTNYGTATVLRADASPGVVSYLAFPVSVTRPVQHATLRLYATGKCTAGVAAYGTSTGWQERTLTWSNAPPLGTASGSSGAISAAGWYSLDVSDLVTGQGNVAIAVTTPGSTQCAFGSRESGTPPELDVTVG